MPRRRWSSTSRSGSIATMADNEAKLRGSDCSGVSQLSSISGGSTYQQHPSPLSGNSVRQFGAAERSSSLHFLTMSQVPASPRQNPEFPSLVQTSKRQSSVHLTENFTINKLQFSPNILYGRDAELNRLQQVILQPSTSLSDTEDNGTTIKKKMQDNANTKAFVLISGESGVGKTSLARQLAIRIRNHCQTIDKTKDNMVAVVRGAFALDDQPFSAVGQAMGELCGRILSLSDTTGRQQRRQEESADYLAKLRHQLTSDLMAEDLGAICQVVPTLEEIICHKSVFDDNDDGMISKLQQPSVSVASGRSHNAVTEERKNRFNHAFCKFLRIVMSSDFVSNLILVLDDLHWADQPSLDLIVSILADHELPNLVIIGTSRPDGVRLPTEGEEDDTPTNPLAKTLVSLKEKAAFLLERTELDCLTVQNVHEMLQDLLRSDDLDLLQLAELCHRKTRGNVFFLKQYLQFLTEKHLLNFNMGSLRWMWDIVEIEIKTQATDNVVDLMKISMDELPEGVCGVLQLAACLGASFQVGTLRLAWEEYNNKRRKVDGESSQRNEAGRTGSQLDDYLQIAIDRGFFIPSQNQSASASKTNTGHTGKLIWVHSKILESAVQYIPENDRSKVRANIGEILFQSLAKSDLDEAIFVVADLVNEGYIGQENQSTVLDPIALAKLNHQAMDKAISIAAFECAAHYAERGIECLRTQQQVWNSQHRDLALDLYSVLVEVESVTGQFARAESRCNEVLNLADLSVVDKAGFYYILILHLYSANKMKEARDLAVNVLAKVGCKFPKSTAAQRMNATMGLLRIKMTAKSRTIEEVASLPLLKDPRRIQVIRILERFMTICYYLKDPLLLPVTLRLYSWTFKYGVSEFAPGTVANIALMLAAFLSDFDTSKKLGDYSLALLKKVEDKIFVVRVYIVVWAGVMHYSMPIHSILKPFQEGYEIGMQTGDFCRALHCLMLYLQASLVSGRPLPLIESDCRLFTRQMVEFKQEVLVDCVGEYLRTVTYLMCNGTADAEIESIARTSCGVEVASKRNVVNQAYYNTLALQRAVWFGDYEKAVDLATHNIPISKAVPGCCLSYSDNLFRGIACLEMCRRRKRQRRGLFVCKTSDQKLARQIITTTKKWVEKGNPNIRHHEALLEAEWAALYGKKHVARKHYDIAIVMASRHGFIHDAALANERYGGFLLQDLGEKEDALHRLQEAVKLYKEWGAHAKANQLLEKYEDIWRIPGSVPLFES